MSKVQLNRKIRRKKRISLNLYGTSSCPRLIVFRSNKHIYVQAVNDDRRMTLGAFSSLNLKKNNTKTKKSDVARQVGLSLAKALKDKKIAQAVFDRNVYAYLGRVKALAEGLREGGIKI